jgi:hypothetical protein
MKTTTSTQLGNSRSLLVGENGTSTSGFIACASFALSKMLTYSSKLWAGRSKLPISCEPNTQMSK